MTSPAEKPKEGKDKEKPKGKHSFKQVWDEWFKNQPKPTLVHFYHNDDEKPSYFGTFCFSHEVVLDGYRYIVQSHVHLGHNKKDIFPGNTYVPGIEGQSSPTPGFVQLRTPHYSASTHVDDWCTDITYRTKLYDEDTDYRYPTNVGGS